MLVSMWLCLWTFYVVFFHFSASLPRDGKLVILSRLAGQGALSIYSSLLSNAGVTVCSSLSGLYTGAEGWNAGPHANRAMAAAPHSFAKSDDTWACLQGCQRQIPKKMKLAAALLPHLVSGCKKILVFQLY